MLTSDELENASERAVWHMVWVDDFGANKLQHKDLSPHLEKFIRSVKIYTSVIDDRVVIMAANAGCNHIQWQSSNRMVEPPRTIETFIDGKPALKTIPAVYHPSVRNIYTQVDCGLHYDIDGNRYEVNWSSNMEDFLIKNMRQYGNLRKDKLEWISQDGTPFARFEKLPD